MAKVSAARWAWAAERWSKGDPLTVIASRLGVTPQAVQLHGARHGWPKRYKVDRGVVIPKRWRCYVHDRTCTASDRCDCRQVWEGAA